MILGAAASPARRWSAAFGVWLAGAVIFFRATVFSGFGRLTGDTGDARLVAVLHEHWLEVLRGRQSWRSPNFFHPVRDALGYSDTFLVNEVFYAPLRAIGLDRSLALQWTMILLTLAGFVGAILVLTRIIGVAWWPSLALAYVMTFANSLAVQAYHAQLFSLHWLPWAVLLVHSAWHAPSRRTQALRAAGAGALVGLLLFSTFYVAWFAVFGGGLFAIFTAVQLRDRLHIRPVHAFLRRVWLPLIAFVLGLAPPLIAFAFTYLPTLDENGGRTYAEVINAAPALGDVVNVGGHNLLWGPVLRALLGDNPRLSALEIADAPTPLLSLAIACCAVLLVWRLRGVRSTSAAVARSLVTVVALLALLPLRIGSTFSLWRSVWLLVPGARALRAIGRLEMLAAYLAPLAIAATFIALREAGVAAPRAVRRWVRPAVAVGLALLAVEQWNTDDLGKVHRDVEAAFIADLPTPPSECRSFVMAAAPGRTDVELQVDAMIVAQVTGLPTVNGYSGSSPPYWSLHPNQDNVDEQLAIWVQLHHLTDVCTYDRVTNRWSIGTPA